MITHEILGDDMQARGPDARRRRRRPRGSRRADVHDRHRSRWTRRWRAGLLGGLKRKFLAGESLVHHLLQGHQRPARRSRLRGPCPGKIIHVNLNGQRVLCQRDAFLCATGEIDFSIAFTKRLGAGFFGGEGFILQKMEGTRRAVHPQRRHDRAVRSEAGRAAPASTPAASSASRRDRSTTTSPASAGSRRACSAAKGCSSPSLTGPGRVWLQTLPFFAPRRADPQRLPQRPGRRQTRLGGALGKIGDLIGESDKISRLSGRETVRHGYCHVTRNRC